MKERGGDRDREAGEEEKVEAEGKYQRLKKKQRCEAAGSSKCYDKRESGERRAWEKYKLKKR